MTPEEIKSRLRRADIRDDIHVYCVSDDYVIVGEDAIICLLNDAYEQAAQVAEQHEMKHPSEADFVEHDIAVKIRALKGPSR